MQGSSLSVRPFFLLALAPCLAFARLFEFRGRREPGQAGSQITLSLCSGLGGRVVNTAASKGTNVLLFELHKMQLAFNVEDPFEKITIGVAARQQRDGKRSFCGANVMSTMKLGCTEGK